jgi:hypothetical protein
MIATVSPNSGNSEHTLNTLRYADRVKELKSEPNDTSVPNFIAKPQTAQKIQSQDMDLEPDFSEADVSIMDEDPPSVPDFTTPKPEKEPVISVSIPSPTFAEVTKLKKKTILTQLNKASPTKLKFYPSSRPEDNKRRPSTSHDSRGSSVNTGLPRPTTSYQVKKIDTQAPVVRLQPKSSPSPVDNSPTGELSTKTINDFIRTHRKELREITDASKEETQLLFQLTQSGFVQAGSDNPTNVEQDAVASESSQAFLQYLTELDKQLDRKYRSIASLRQKVRPLLKTLQQK